MKAGENKEDKIRLVTSNEEAQEAYPSREQRSLIADFEIDANDGASYYFLFGVGELLTSTLATSFSHRHPGIPSEGLWKP